MAVQSDFSLAQYEASTLVLSMAPPVAVGGRNIRFQMLKRFGASSGIYQAFCASGFNGASGITLTNSGTGVMNISIPSVATSGLDLANYSFVVEFLDSPRTLVADGFVLLNPAGTI